MEQQQFSLTLSNKFSTDIFPNNTCSNFSIQFTNPIKLNADDWEVGLADIIFPSQVYTLTNDDWIQITCCNDDDDDDGGDDNGNGVLKTLIVDNPIKFDSIERLVDYMNGKMNSEISPSQCQFIYNTDLNEFSIDLKIGAKMIWSKSMMDIFGYLNQHFEGKGYLHHAPLGLPLLNRGINHLYIYSSISEFIHVRDTKAPLLRIVPFVMQQQSVANKNYQHFEFKHIIYANVTLFTVSTINIKFVMVLVKFFLL